MSDLIVKSSPLFGSVRFINIEEKPYVVAKDVASALGYKDTTNAIKQHCKGVVKHHLPHPKNKNKELEVNVIPEGDIYRLIIRSKLPQVEKFERWVFDEVLPQIRITGGYIPNNEEDDDASIMAKALMIAQKTINKKDELLKSKTRELEDKNRFIKQISASQNSLLVREVAKIISSKESEIVIGEKALYQKLRDWGLIFKNKNEPKQQYVNQGLFEVVEGIRNTETGIFTYQTMRITGKGQTYILKRLLREHQLNRHLA